MNRNRPIFGQDQPPIDPIVLRTGPLTMILEPTTGFLRYLELPDGTEAFRGIYPTIRHNDWSTAEYVVRDLKHAEDKNGFKVSFTMSAASVGYSAKVSITASDGALTYALDGAFAKDFETNRTGLCLLHPHFLADEPVEIRHPDGTRESGRLPDLVRPDWPFRDIISLAFKLPGYRVEASMEGEIFEMEDQRNWGDASFKTYCRPQSRPFPYIVKANEPIQQSIRIEAKKWGAAAPVEEEIPEGLGGLMFAEEALPIPLFGLIAPDDLTRDEAITLPVDFLRVSDRAVRDLGIPLEVTVNLGEDSEVRLGQAVRDIGTLENAPDRVIVEPTDAVSHVIPLKEALGDVSVLIGADEFGQINRSKFTPNDVDGVAFAYQPQTHLTDIQTLFDNAEVLPDLVATAAERTEGPIAVGPITLSGSEDPREGTLLHAAWTVAAIASVVKSEVDAVTLGDWPFDGPKVTPAYHVLADIHDFAEGELVAAFGTPRRVAGYGLILDERFRTVLANLTPKPIKISAVAVSEGDQLIRVLDVNSLSDALNTPMEWRKKGVVRSPEEGAIVVELGPYGIATIDTQVDDLK